MMRAVIISTIIVLLGGGAYGVHLWFANKPPAAVVVSSPDEPRPEPALRDTNSGERTSEVALLRQQLANLQQEVAALRSKPADSPAVEDPESIAPKNPSRREIAAASEAWHAHMASVEADFFKEPYDRQWASNMTAVLRDVAGKNEAIHQALQKFECHSQTCRVEMKDDGSGMLAEQLPFFLQQMGHALPIMESDHLEGGGGEKTLVMFLSKQPGA
jgi:hypothetical protein